MRIYKTESQEKLSANASASHSQRFAANSNVTAANMENTPGSSLIRKRCRGVSISARTAGHRHGSSTRPCGSCARRTGLPQISGYLKLNGINISHERIYQEVSTDGLGKLWKHGRHKMKYRRHKGHRRKTSGRTLIPNRISIHQRPVEADGTRFGDWEMDLIIGKGQKSAVLTMIERKTKMFLQSNLTSL